MGSQNQSTYCFYCFEGTNNPKLRQVYRANDNPQISFFCKTNPKCEFCSELIQIAPYILVTWLVFLIFQQTFQITKNHPLLVLPTSSKSQSAIKTSVKKIFPPSFGIFFSRWGIFFIYNPKTLLKTFNTQKSLVWIGKYTQFFGKRGGLYQYTKKPCFNTQFKQEKQLAATQDSSQLLVTDRGVNASGSINHEQFATSSSMDQ